MIQPSKPSYSSDFGGTKQDYAPIFDPSTDRSANEINSVFASVAGVAQTAPLAVYKIELNTTTYQFTISKNLSFIGNNLEICSYSGTGLYSFKFYTDVYDNLNNAQTLTPSAIVVTQNCSIPTAPNSPVLLSAYTSVGSDISPYINLEIQCRDLTNTYADTLSFLVIIY